MVAGGRNAQFTDAWKYGIFSFECFCNGSSRSNIQYLQRVQVGQPNQAVDKLGCEVFRVTEKGQVDREGTAQAFFVNHGQLSVNGSTYRT